MRGQKAQWERGDESESGAFLYVEFFSCSLCPEPSIFCPTPAIAVQILVFGSTCRSALDKLKRRMNAHGDMASVLIQADNMIKEQKVGIHEISAREPLLVNKSQPAQHASQLAKKVAHLLKKIFFLHMQSFSCGAGAD